MKRSLLLVGFLFGCAGPSTDERSNDRRDAPPNIILIMADDCGADNYGCYGSSFFETPRLDALAETGMRFTHCYSTPVCTPSRVEIMTGREGVRNYVRFGVLDEDEVTFGNMLKDAGYATAVAGKWQLYQDGWGSLAPDCGFDTFCLWSYPNTERPRYWKPSLVRDDKLLTTTDDDYGPTIFTDFLIDFIEENRTRPFFAYYPMALVHSPFKTTPDSGPEVEGQSHGLLRYRDMLCYVDKCVGRIVDALEENGLRENTVLLFTADNGSNRGLKYPYGDETRKGEKAYATHRGTHVPLIVNCPGTVPAGRVVDDLIDFSDFLPTLASISRAELPAVEVDGRCFWSRCQGREGDPRDWIYQYYYPKFGPAAEAHGQGINGREVVWAQNHDFKLYQDGSLYSTSDLAEVAPIEPGSSEQADVARHVLQGALDSMPQEAQKLIVPTGLP